MHLYLRYSTVVLIVYICRLLQRYTDSRNKDGNGLNGSGRAIFACCVHPRNSMHEEGVSKLRNGISATMIHHVVEAESLFL